MAQKEKFNVYDHITQTILAQLEAGTVPWRKPWTGGGGGIPIPLRHEGTSYQGINVCCFGAEQLIKATSARAG